MHDLVVAIGILHIAVRSFRLFPDLLVSGMQLKLRLKSCMFRTSVDEVLPCVSLSFVCSFYSFVAICERGISIRIERGRKPSTGSR